MSNGGVGKAGSDIEAAVRHELATLARNPHRRTAEFTRERPTDWRPHQVLNPDGDLDTHFTDTTAWELIATRLEQGQHVKVIELQKPRGRKGYVMSIDLGTDTPNLYVKLQLGSGQIIGRSFHYSERD